MRQSATYNVQRKTDGYRNGAAEGGDSHVEMSSIIELALGWLCSTVFRVRSLLSGSITRSTFHGEKPCDISSAPASSSPCGLALH